MKKKEEWRRMNCGGNEGRYKGGGGKEEWMGIGGVEEAECT